MKIDAVVLAAGLGKRMKSNTPKVLHKILGKPIINYITDAINGVDAIDKTLIVVSPHTEALVPLYKGTGTSIAWQNPPLGTADALKSALIVNGGNFDYLLVLAGDVPLIRPETLEALIGQHITHNNALTLITFNAAIPGSYGRIKRNPDGTIAGIIEENDASDQEKTITEVNSGIYVFERTALSYLDKIERNPKKGEFYLTDIVAICNSAGLRVEAALMAEEAEFVGVNSRADLLAAQMLLQQRLAARWMAEGVTLMNIDSILISPDVVIGMDTVIYPDVILEGHTEIGQGCTIYPGVIIIDTIVGDNVIIKNSSVIENSEIEAQATIGPFAHLRPGSVVGIKAKVGNFVEIKNSTVGANTKVSHLSYIGDSQLGRDVNIGAGTITCNYDGKKKHRTVIKDNVFIGSGTELVAPVTVGENAFVGAGSTITIDVPDDALAVARGRQKNIHQWAAKKNLVQQKAMQHPNVEKIN
ncbi:MAG: bifunctional UDP-N-acetylglucosamine diphosphorylase/glucosamine-1-phosphate N-acetyltransferase GlmU [Nitrospirae bacterium]|uniref:bifunctional UDP-N-acetylglucosamine diphosphorylase/glucosamine-1-phosphate N-acetyltransferase GlmU n=1 Tax=Candidatus Magnetobacterium casense TaxID=1455061 RepID=UPI0009DDAB33|nr:bifunctional UDP-N-acetylglucosamine diphosphorylase/glucosamine-1-phosphate N-acetyltransferase GlmU [Candidatus Magnetobacterium casensis]MBF0338665.1 bifunctional UDP-N-acetylglucosamine diphosphorylase/glucosamine-1-phosphate N-acetyltransferase GlmU [Nitrospirota bacterium]